MNTKAIDCLINVHFGETESQPTWMLKVRDDYFKGPESMFAPVDLSELLEEMDEQGVQKAVLMDNLANPSTTARKFVEAKPDRFALAMGGVNLLRPVRSLRELTAVVGDLPVAYAVVGPSFWGDGQYPPSDAVYYPLYAKCAELDLPLCINTGIPGPPIPGEVQHPMHLDRVCVRFPELRLCMIHGADPWWDVAIRLLLKYANLRLMTSAWSPKRLPESLLHYMRTRGPNKVIYASDWPVLRMRRVVPEARALDLPAEVLDNYLYNNAQEFFFGKEKLTMDRFELRRLDYSLSERPRGLCRLRTSNSSRPTARSKQSAPQNHPASTRTSGSGCARWARPRWRYRSPVAATGRRWSISRWWPKRSAGRWRRFHGSTTSAPPAARAPGSVGRRYRRLRAWPTANSSPHSTHGSTAAGYPADSDRFDRRPHHRPRRR